MYTLTLPAIPCDVVLAARKGSLYALQFTASRMSGTYLGETKSDDCTIMCKAHTFRRECVSINFDDGMGLVDGVCCSPISLSETGRRFLDEVCSC